MTLAQENGGVMIIYTTAKGEQKTIHLKTRRVSSIVRKSPNLG